MTESDQSNYSKEMFLADIKSMGTLEEVLAKAACIGDHNKVQILMSNALDLDLNKALCGAAQNGQLKIVELLLQRKFKQKWLLKALMKAADGDHHEIVQLLLKRIVADRRIRKQQQMHLYADWAIHSGSYSIE